MDTTIHNVPYKLLVAVPKTISKNEKPISIFLKPRGAREDVPENFSLIGAIPLERTLQDLTFPPSGMSLLLMSISAALSIPALYAQGKAAIEKFLTEGYRRHRNPKSDNHPEKQLHRRASLSETTYRQNFILWKKMATHFIEAMIHDEALEIIYRRIDRLIAEAD